MTRRNGQNVSIAKEKKKIERRRRKAKKIKDFIENSIGLILIIAGIIGGITAAIFIAKKCLSRLKLLRQA